MCFGKSGVGEEAFTDNLTGELRLKALKGPNSRPFQGDKQAVYVIAEQRMTSEVKKLQFFRPSLESCSLATFPCHTLVRSFPACVGPDEGDLGLYGLAALHRVDKTPNRSVHRLCEARIEGKLGQHGGCFQDAGHIGASITLERC